MVSATHLRLKRNDLQNHLDREHPGEDHVQDVHGVIEHLGLLVVLWTETEEQLSEAPSRLTGGGPRPFLPVGDCPLGTQTPSTSQYPSPMAPLVLSSPTPCPQSAGALAR